MKNEQQNNQTGKQGSSLKQGAVNNNEQNQQQKKDDWTHTSTGNPEQVQKQDQPAAGNEKSNISVDNDGRIGKAHDQWGNDTGNEKKDIQKDPQVKSDKTVTEPEIDAPIYDPEKTEKKLPRMDGKK
ncbi:MAG: hypothetical protein ABIQ88_16255 [Chitinophagaceae bacterium]